MQKFAEELAKAFLEPPNSPPHKINLGLDSPRKHEQNSQQPEFSPLAFQQPQISPIVLSLYLRKGKLFEKRKNYSGLHALNILFQSLSIPLLGWELGGKKFLVNPEDKGPILNIAYFSRYALCDNMNEKILYQLLSDLGFTLMYVDVDEEIEINLFTIGFLAKKENKISAIVKFGEKYIFVDTENDKNITEPLALKDLLPKISEFSLTRIDNNVRVNWEKLNKGNLYVINESNFDGEDEDSETDDSETDDSETDDSESDSEEEESTEDEENTKDEQTKRKGLETNGEGLANEELDLEGGSKPSILNSKQLYALPESSLERVVEQNGNGFTMTVIKFNNGTKVTVLKSQSDKNGKVNAILQNVKFPERDALFTIYKASDSIQAADSNIKKALKYLSTYSFINSNPLQWFKRNQWKIQ